MIPEKILISFFPIRNNSILGSTAYIESSVLWLHFQEQEHSSLLGQIQTRYFAYFKIMYIMNLKTLRLLQNFKLWYCKITRLFPFVFGK